MAGVDADAAAAVMRRHRFAVRRETVDGVTYLDGDRNRWTKLATLLTHTGLVLFLLAAWITANFGFEQGLVVAEGESLTVQPIGTPGLLLVRNLGFEAPWLQTGMATDFTTRLAVYQDGRQIAEKTIRVVRPARGRGLHLPPERVRARARRRDPRQGRQAPRSGPIPMTDQAAGFPLAEFAVPGRDVALQLLLQRASDGAGVLLVVPFRAVGTNPDGSPVIVGLEPIVLTRGQSDTADGTDFSIELRSFGEFTLLIAKRDPGANVVWTAFGFLIVGLLITFWMPRRRVWGRLDADGRLALVVRADRYVDVGREFGRLLDDLVRSRRAGAAPVRRTRSRGFGARGRRRCPRLSPDGHAPRPADAALPGARSVGADVSRPRRAVSPAGLWIFPGPRPGAGRARGGATWSSSPRPRCRSSPPHRPTPATSSRRWPAAGRPRCLLVPAQGPGTAGGGETTNRGAIPASPDPFDALGPVAAEAGIPAIRVDGTDSTALERRGSSATSWTAAGSWSARRRCWRRTWPSSPWPGVGWTRWQPRSAGFCAGRSPWRAAARMRSRSTPRPMCPVRRRPSPRTCRGPRPPGGGSRSPARPATRRRRGGWSCSGSGRRATSTPSPPSAWRRSSRWS